MYNHFPFQSPKNVPRLGFSAWKYMYNKMSVDKMSVDKMSEYEMSVDKMTVKCIGRQISVCSPVGERWPLAEKMPLLRVK
jgi:hypothetical protein